MVKYLCVMVGIFIFFVTPWAYAQEVTVEGVSLDKESALRAAERAAVEQVIGNYIDSTTLVEQGVTELDEIYARADGYARVVKILSEGARADGYFVQAVIDVDTNPNAELMSKVQMLTRLNDPRIAVIILKEGQYNAHEKLAESIIMERLVALGFSHVVDANVVAALHDARMLESLYRGEAIGSVGKSFGVDYVVIGSSRSTVGQGKIPDFKGGYKTVALNTGNMDLVVKIIKPSTGDVIDTFSLEGKGMGISQEAAERDMIKKVAGEAAQKVEERLRKLSLKASGSVQIVAISGNYDKVAGLVQELKKLSGVQGVHLREHNGNRAIIEVETNQKTSTIIHLLQNRNAMPFYVESMTDSKAEVVLP